jgi:hypothetical protein
VRHPLARRRRMDRPDDSCSSRRLLLLHVARLQRRPAASTTAAATCGGTASAASGASATAAPLRGQTVRGPAGMKAVGGAGVLRFDYGAGRPSAAVEREWRQTRQAVLAQPQPMREWLTSSASCRAIIAGEQYAGAASSLLRYYLRSRVVHFAANLIVWDLQVGQTGNTHEHHMTGVVWMSERERSRETDAGSSPTLSPGWCFPADAAQTLYLIGG